MEPASRSVLVLLKLSLFGMDISISSVVIVVWLAVFIIFVFTYLATRHPTVVPDKLQSVIEIVYEFWESQTSELLQEETQRWIPFIFSLFCFILVCNLLGLIPGVYPITSNINITITLALIVFLSYHLAGIKDHGVIKYLKSFVPTGVPVYIAPFLFFIEIVGHLARPFSLAIRLFANMTAGHVITLTLLSLIFLLNNVLLAAFPFLGRIAIGLFEVFVAFVQAYIFAYLAALYIGLAINE